MAKNLVLQLIALVRDTSSRLADGLARRLNDFADKVNRMGEKDRLEEMENRVREHLDVDRILPPASIWPVHDLDWRDGAGMLLKADQRDCLVEVCDNGRWFKRVQLDEWLVRYLLGPTGDLNKRKDLEAVRPLADKLLKNLKKRGLIRYSSNLRAWRVMDTRERKLGVERAAWLVRCN